MNKKNLPHIITLVSFVVFIVLGLACASTSNTSNQWKDIVYNGEDYKALAGTTWSMTVSDWPNNRQPDKIDFLSNGRVIKNGNGGNSWERRELGVNLVVDNGYSFIEGKINPENNTISGTITRSNGTSANVSMQLIDGGTNTTLKTALAAENLMQEEERQRKEKVSYFTGDGGKTISLGIGTPKSQGLSADQVYLPTLVQGVLVDSISKYSEVKVLDRVSLDRVIAETLDLTFADNMDIVRLGHVAQVGNWLTGNIIRTSSGFTLQLNITDTTPNAITVASYTGTCTVTDFDNHSAIHKAALALLEGMGIVLTDKGKTELVKASSEYYIQAQTALSKGIVAQRQGTEVAALGYFIQAAAIDSSLAKEANSRSAVISANIKSGNIGTDARNDVAWRKRWIERLTETEQYFDTFHKTKSVPYTLFYSNEIKQGTINYKNETIDLSIEMNLRANETWLLPLQKMLRTIYNGLDSTERKKDWGLSDWPEKCVTTLKPFDRKTINFSITTELVNDHNKVIGNRTFNVTRGWGWESLSYSPYINITERTYYILTFTVKVDDITDNLKIRIVSVNGKNAETAARDGILKIVAMTKDVYDSNCIEFSFGKAGEYTKKREPINILIYPETIWDEPVTSIKDTIYFSDLISLTFPNSVTYIGYGSFGGCPLTSITIGENVEIIRWPVPAFQFVGGFVEFYDNNGRKAGTYTRTTGRQFDNKWSFRP